SAGGPGSFSSFATARRAAGTPPRSRTTASPIAASSIAPGEAGTRSGSPPARPSTLTALPPRPRPVHRAGPELGLDPQQLVVLRDPVRARGAARLDLTAIRPHGDVRDRRVLGLARAV